MKTAIPPLRILAPRVSVGASTVQFSREELTRVFSVILADVDVDEAWYLAAYEDVAAAVKRGDVRSARQHFCEFGYLEGRLPGPPDVDEEWYLRVYPDVARGVSEGRLKSATEHYVKFGATENRAPRRAHFSASSNS